MVSSSNQSLELSPTSTEPQSNFVAIDSTDLVQSATSSSACRGIKTTQVSLQDIRGTKDAVCLQQAPPAPPNSHGPGTRTSQLTDGRTELLKAFAELRQLRLNTIAAIFRHESPLIPQGYEPLELLGDGANGFALSVWDQSHDMQVSSTLCSFWYSLVNGFDMSDSWSQRSAFLRAKNQQRHSTASRPLSSIWFPASSAIPPSPNQYTFVSWNHFG